MTPHGYRGTPVGPVEHRSSRGAFASVPTTEPAASRHAAFRHASSARLTSAWRVLLLPACLLVLALVAAPGAYAATPAPQPPPAANGGAEIAVGTATAAPGSDVTVTGSGWSPGSMVNIAVCGRNGQGGSQSCSVATSVSTTVPTGGTIEATLKVETPPVPCPCVIRVVTVTGGTAPERTTPLEIPGAPHAPLSDTGKSPGRLTFIRSEMTGGDTIFTWFGSPVSRRFRIEVGNMGETPITNPVFRIGTFEGVFAPTWEDKTWNGTIQPGRRVTVSLPIELRPRQHGEFRYRVMYGDKVVDEVVLDVGRPWGVYLFGALAIVVVPMTVWRLGGNLVRAVKEHRRQLSAERSREVGAPGASGLRQPTEPPDPSEPADPSDPDGADDEDAGREHADRPDAEPVPVPAAAGPTRCVDEPLIVGTPLFPPSVGEADGLSNSPGEKRSSSADGAPAQDTAPEAETRVLPPVRSAVAGTAAAERPSEATRVLAGKPGEERETP
ncbi:MAG TPA: hypothetical protein VLH10_14965 [Yinghuangia sp.]|nr:hypothetical protein [Yinghuangia sp.]